MNIHRLIAAVLFGFAVALLSLLTHAIERILKPQE